MANKSDTTVRRVKLSDVVTERLREMIINEMKPGDKFLSEKDLAAKLGVGRSSIREALIVLSSVGLVERGNEGTFVCELPADFLVEPLSLLLQLDNADIMDVLELREILELEAVTRATCLATPEDIANLETIMWEMLRPGLETDEFIEADVRLHQYIAGTSGNKILKEIIGSVRIVLNRFHKQICYDPDVQKAAISQHKKLIKAISEKDTETARQIMKEHLKVSRIFHGFSDENGD